jgi:isopenicillin-N N-acyltransferase-like protein
LIWIYGSEIINAEIKILRTVVRRMISDVYLPAIHLHYPSAVEELQGIAKGAAVPLDDIIMLNARYDLARCKGYFQKEIGTQVTCAKNQLAVNEDIANECTSVYISPEVTSTGDALTAQNWDNAAHLYYEDTIIYLESHPSEDTPSTFILTEAGQLIRSGMNSAGLGLTANSLMSTADFVPMSYTNTAGMVVDGDTVLVLPISLLRRKFLECDTFADALHAVQNSPRHVSMNITVSTREGFGMCLEVTPDHLFKVYCKDGYIVHTNHFVDTGFRSRSDCKDAYPGGSSWYRRERFEKAIRPYVRITEDNLINGFRDHLGFPSSVCEHVNKKAQSGGDYAYSGPSLTVACILYNLTQQSVRVCKGPPCQGVFETFRLQPHGNKSHKEEL